MIRNLPVLLLLSFCNSLFAQTPADATESFDYYLELISELSIRSEEETDFNDLAYELYELWESPVNINTAGPYEFSRLFWLSELQLNSLIDYVQKQKPVVSIYELAFVPGFDTTLVLSLKPFINISDVRDNNRFGPKSKHWFMFRMGRTIEEQKGFREKKFEGDAWKQNLRYKYQYGAKIFAGFNMEKDAGETLFKGSNRAGPDFYSGYLKVNNPGFIKTVCLGNYSIGFGQGLVAGPGFALGKSSQAVNLIQKETGIRAYTSNDENRYFQGVASTLSLNPVELSVFLSYKKVDANVTLKDSAEKVREVSSLQITGFHSALSEIADENSIAEFSAGGRVLVRKSRFQAGMTFIHSRFDAKIVPAPADYNQFYFSGDKQSNFGIDYKFNFSNTIVFGEEAIDIHGNTAFLNGITSNIGGRLQFSLLHRYYSRAYHSFYGNAFGENTRVQNEEGIYGGLRMPVLRHINLAFYADFFRFPWLKFGVDAPSYGREYFLQVEYNPASSFSAYIQYRNKQKQANAADSLESTNNIIVSQTNRVRLHMAYQASEHFSLSARLELGLYEKERMKKDRSYLLYQDIKYIFNKLPLQFNLRYALFKTDSYDSRIYAYENDVLYAFSMNAYYMQGQRYYAMMKYSPGKMIDLWIKYSQSLYPTEKSIGSGLFEIDGNSRSDIRMQVILKF